MISDNIATLFLPPKNHPQCDVAKNSYFISFEGIEGSGKTTQIARFSKHLEAQGLSVHLFREPGGTEFGEKMRQAILSSKSSIHPLAEAHLFAASRAQLIQERISPILRQVNQVVIVDRFLDSSLAYQGHAGGLGIQTILEIHRHYPLTLVPDLSFYLKIDLDTSVKRQNQRGAQRDYFESQSSDFHQKLIQGFDAAAQIFSQRFRVINGALDEDDVTQELLCKWKEFLQRQLPGSSPS